MSSADYSPGWKKPADVMRMLRRRSIGINNVDTQSPACGGSANSLSPHTGPTRCASVGASRAGKKRKNPFSCSPLKPRRLNVELSQKETTIDKELKDNEDAKQMCKGDDDRVKTMLFEQLDKYAKNHKTASEQVLLDHGKGTNARSMTLPTVSNSIQINPESIDEKVKGRDGSDELDGDRSSSSFPVDWSLRTKIRYASPRSFSWCSPLASADEAQGTRAFVAGSKTTTDWSLLKDVANCSIAKQEFQKCLMYWIHPNLPWLQLFPRVTVDNPKMGATAFWTHNEEVLKVLHSDWSESMTSAYQSVRTGLCAYMYVCCHNMTVMFRAEEGSGPCSEGEVRRGNHRVQAVLTPSSRGLRDALKREDIEFTLPLQETPTSRLSSDLGNNPATGSSPTTNNLTSTDSPNTQEESDHISCSTTTVEVVEDEEENEENTTDESASRWLEDLGLDKNKYKSVDPGKVRDQRDDFRRIDYRPESTIYVDGVHVNALFNFLLNFNGCFATAGHQAGLPPTILAPSPFKGATLQSLKVRQCGKVRLDSKTSRASDDSSSFVMEIVGPILPHAIDGLTKLFARSQAGEFTASYSVNDPTAPLNALLLVSKQRDRKFVAGRQEFCSSCDDSVFDSDQSIKSDFVFSTTTDGRFDMLDGMRCAWNCSKSSDVFDDVHIGKSAIKEMNCCGGRFTWTI